MRYPPNEAKMTRAKGESVRIGYSSISNQVYIWLIKNDCLL